MTIQQASDMIRNCQCQDDIEKAIDALIAHGMKISSKIAEPPDKKCVCEECLGKKSVADKILTARYNKVWRKE